MYQVCIISSELLFCLRTILVQRRFTFEESISLIGGSRVIYSNVKELQACFHRGGNLWLQQSTVPKDENVPTSPLLGLVTWMHSSGWIRDPFSQLSYRSPCQ